MADFADTIRETIDGEIFSLNELKAVFCPLLSEIALQNRVSRSKKLIRLKKGLYIFSRKWRRKALYKSVVAGRLYSPSYISFESALSYHTWIPEGVYTTTSACFQRKNKHFSNTLGNFSFDYIPVRPFFMGVEQNMAWGNSIMATALRALFDLVYIQRKKYSSVRDIEDDLRVDEDEIEKEMSRIGANELKKLAKAYKKKNIITLCEVLLKEFK